MKLPNKIICYKESVLHKLPIVLSILEKADLSAVELFNSVKSQMENVAEFLDVIDCLFALGKIDFDSRSGNISYVA